MPYAQDPTPHAPRPRHRHRAGSRAEVQASSAGAQTRSKTPHNGATRLRLPSGDTPRAHCAGRRGWQHTEADRGGIVRWRGVRLCRCASAADTVTGECIGWSALQHRLCGCGKARTGDVLCVDLHQYSWRCPFPLIYTLYCCVLSSVAVAHHIYLRSAHTPTS